MENDENRPVCPYLIQQIEEPNSNYESMLMDCISVIWDRRYLVICLTVSSCVIALIYAFLNPKVYKTETVVSPFMEFEKMSYSAINFNFANNGFKTADVFGIVSNNLKDKTLQSKFWESFNNAYKMREQKAEFVGITKHDFLQNIFVKRNVNQQMLIVLTGEKPLLITDLLNGFIEFAIQYSDHEVENMIKEKLEEKKKNLESQADLMRKATIDEYFQKIHDLKERQVLAEELELLQMGNEIKRIKEQIGIARSLRILKPPMVITEEPMYARGVEALLAEKNLLEKKIAHKDFSSVAVLNFRLQIDQMTGKDSGDIVAKSIQNLVYQIKWIDEINLTKLDIKTSLYNKAAIPKNLYKPNFKVLVSVAGIIGLSIGVILSFLFQFRKIGRGR
nr:Wzz/FepE/Etk N-terminal domain-containing protein [uncultured Desulfobacter sp.]